MNSSFCLYAAWTDAALLDAMREDQEQAFTEIYKRYCYRIFTVAYRKLKNCEVAEELVQDLFADLWTRRSSNQIQQLENYLFTAIRYRIINYIKAQQVKSGYELYCRLSASEADTDTEKSLAHNDLSDALLTSMRKLPEKSREIFQLSRLEHYSVSEISVRVKLSEKSVEYHLTKSLKLLRTYLRDYLLLGLIFFLWPN